MLEDILIVIAISAVIVLVYYAIERIFRNRRDRKG